MRFSESTQYPALIIFSFLLSTCNRNTYFQTINQYFVVYRFVSEWKRQVVIEQTRFLSTVFLCSEFKLENIYSGLNFCGKNVCRNLFLRIAEKITKIRTRKNFVPHDTYEYSILHITYSKRICSYTLTNSGSSVCNCLNWRRPTPPIKQYNVVVVFKIKQSYSSIIRFLNVQLKAILCRVYKESV